MKTAIDHRGYGAYPNSNDRAQDPVRILLPPTAFGSAWRAIAAALLAAVLVSHGSTPETVVDNQTDPAKAFAALQALVEAGQPTVAARQLREFVRIHHSWERLRDANLLLGTALIRGGEIASGRDVLDRIILDAPQSPDSATAHYYRGRALEALGDFPSAVLAYRDVWTRFEQDALAPEAALAEGLLAETVLNNPARAREAYEAFLTRYDKHPRAGAVMNRLAMLLDRVAAHAEARDLYRRYVERFPSDAGDPTLGGPHAGAAAACLRAAQLSQQLNDAAGAAALFKAYEELPMAVKGEGWSQAAHMARGLEEGREAAALYERAVAANPRDDYRRALADWLYERKDPAAQKHYLGLASVTADRVLSAHCLSRVEDEPFAAWLAGSPPRLDLFLAYLGRFREGRARQAAGRAVLDAWLARADVHVKTAAARQWREWTGAVEDGRRELKAAIGDGLPRESFEAALWMSDRLLPSARATASAPVFTILDEGKPAGELQVARADKALAVRARVFDPSCRPGEARWPENVSFDLYASMPGGPTVRQVVFAPAGANGGGEARVFENGDPQDILIADWTFVPLAEGGFEVLALVPLETLKIAPDAPRFLLEAAVMRGGRFATLFPTGMENAFRNNSRFGAFAGNAIEPSEGMATRDPRTLPFAGGPAWAFPLEALQAWSGYPDVPAGAAAERLAELARLESAAALPNPRKGEAGQPETIPATRGPAARQAAAETIRKHGLQRSCEGAAALASLMVETGAATAPEDLLHAVRLSIESDQPAVAEPRLNELMTLAPAGDARLLEALSLAAEYGAAKWPEEFRTKRLLPRIEAEVKALEAVLDSEARKWSRLRLLRALDPQRSLGAHDAFLAEHPGSALAPRVRHQRFLEMVRAGKDPAEAIKAAVADLEKNPLGVLDIPPALVPAGPDGATPYARAFETAHIGERADVGPEALLNLMRLHVRLGRGGPAVQAARRLVELHPTAPQAREAKRLAFGVLSKGAMPAGLSQADAEVVFSWLMARTLEGEGPGFADLTGPAWRLAGHPAGRRPSFEHYGQMYQYVTQSRRDRNQPLADLMPPLYATFPGDGAAPLGRMEFDGPPFAIAPQYSSAIWGAFHAPADGFYTFWGEADNWVALEIDGRELNDNNSSWGRSGIYLARGLHLARALFVSTDGNARLRIDWQGPGFERQRLGPEALSADRHPALLDAARANTGVWGLEQWEAYTQKFPRDARGRVVRREVLALSDPQRALAELEAERLRLPGEPRAAQLAADCLWRANRPGDALSAYAALAAFAPEAWETGPARLARDLFMGGQAIEPATQAYGDRLRLAADWPRWFREAVERQGENGGLVAHVGAAGRLDAARAALQVRERALAQLEATVGRERAGRQAAEALANQAESAEDVRAEARRAMARAEATALELERGLPRLRAALDSDRALAAALANHLGIAADAHAWTAAAAYAVAHLGKGMLAEPTLWNLVEAVWTVDREACRPILAHLIARGRNPNFARLADDLYRQIAAPERVEERHAARLLERGMSSPSDGDGSDMLRRACDEALREGDAFVFARAAHLLARLHPDNKAYTGYLARLGEVFEKAGNWVSAEQEYLRAIRAAREDAVKRAAQLSLARLYERLGRPADTLRALAARVSLAVPDEKGVLQPAPARPAPAGGEAAAAEPPAEDAEALLAAARAYLSLEWPERALEAYDRAAAQKEFGEMKPPADLLTALAQICLTAKPTAAGEAGDRHAILPPAVVERANKALSLVDTMFRFHAEAFSAHEKVRATLLRADANMAMRNFPRAFDEIAEARRLAGETPAVYLADLKLGELHLATGDTGQALPVFSRLAQLNLSDVSPLALFWMGTTELRAGRREEAIDAYRRLWERYANNELVRQAVYTIARTYAEQGAFLDAVRLYEAVGAINSLPREKVIPGDMLTVKVLDPDHHVGTGLQTIPVQIRTTSGDVENLQIEMNKINHSLFLGAIRTVLGAPASGDGVLQVFGNDLIYVTYHDRFRVSDPAAGASAGGTEESGSATHTIQVSDNADIEIAPTVFVEREEREEDVFIEKTEEQLAEERRLTELSGQLERGEAVIRPGSDLYIRLKDATMSRTAERDTVTVEVFTYAPETQRNPAQRQQELRQRFADPRPVLAVETVPAGREFSVQRPRAVMPGRHPRLDALRVTLTETEAHSGVFYGTVRTGVNGPTATASDTSGDRVAGYAIDGRDEAEHAWVGFIDGQTNKWLEVDLKELRDVAGIAWSRGQGAEDRYMIDYTITLRGGDVPHDIEITGNTSPHTNRIALSAPVRARWVRFTAHKYDGDAPAIAHVEITDAEGHVVAPPETSPLERAHNDVLEFNVGDMVAAEYLDEFNVVPGRPVTRVSNPLGVAYTDGRIDAVYLSKGVDRHLGSRIFAKEDEVETWWFARRTRRIRPNDVLQIAVIDPDLDVDAELNALDCDLLSSSGDHVTLTATEIESTAGIFQTRIQLSSDEAALDDPERLFTRPGDVVVMRYLDEQNRYPGHAVHRESFVLVVEHEVADFTRTDVAVPSPQVGEDSLSVPHWLLELRDPALALPGTDRTQIRALSFATGDHVVFNALLHNLDGVFSGRLPVAIGEMPTMARTRDADSSAPRRVRPLDEYDWQRGRARGQDAFDIPFAVVGDDIAWFQYDDPTPRMPAARAFLPVLSVEDRGQLGELGAPVDRLDETAVTEGIRVVLRDPHAALAGRNRTRETNVMREIAVKKRHYRGLLGKYETSLERLAARIERLSGGVEPEPAAPEPKDAPPQEVRADDAPLTDEETDGLALDVTDMDLTEDLVLVAALRRDQDGLTQAMRALRERLQALERYQTDELEAAIEREATAASDQAAAPADEGKTPAPAQARPVWHARDDWWRNAGALVPGTRMAIRIEDPDLTGDRVEVALLPMGGQAPRFHRFTAAAVEGEPGVFAVSVATTLDDAAAEGALPIQGASHILMTYEDGGQTNFPARRATYLSLASEGSLSVTGHDFLEEKTSHHLGEDVFMVVRDPDMSKTTERDYVFVEVGGDTGDIEFFALRESQPNSGMFRGSIPTRLGDAQAHDGILQGRFGGSFTVTYLDELRHGEGVSPTVCSAAGTFVSGTDGTVEAFARLLRRGVLQRDVLFNTALAMYELGNSSVEMGAAQRGRHRLLDARERFHTVVQQYPDDPVCAHATYYLGNIHFLLGDYPAAVRSLQEVVTRWPQSEFKTMALFKLGACHIKAGQMERATEAFVTLAYHHPDSPLVGDAMLVLAQHFSAQQRLVPAIGVGEAFLRRFPDHDRVDNMYLRVVGWLIVEERYPRAIELLEEAQERRPRSSSMPAFLYWHADCVLRTAGPRSREMRAALVLLQRIVYDYPDSQWARYASGRLVQMGFQQLQ